MTKQEKEVQQAHLDEEKKVIRLLKKVYERAAKDCGEKIAELNAREDMQNLQSIIYQKQYQQALKNQIDGILATLQTDEFGSIAEYLTASYENGYVGAMYTLKSQGIPIISPIDQSKVVKAVETDSAISQGLYKRLGEDVSELKKTIRAELSRGTANGSSWLEIASHIANGMNSPFKKAYSRAATIARTEGHRIQQESQLDALYTARDTGADLVKQWDAALDARTRPDHRAADGQIREIDEDFSVGGEKMKAPGVGGSAKQVCNCRCCLKHRARSAMDEGELEKLKKRAEYFGLDKTKDFEEFKGKYLKAAESGKSGLQENSFGGKIDDMEIQNVTDDYLNNATPNKGTFAYDVGYQAGIHKKEVEIGNWLHGTLGGNITLLQEDADCKKKTPDFTWNGKSWELKSISSVKAADSALRMASKQIQENPGGVILELVNDMDMAELEKMLSGRFRRIRIDEMDILILFEGTLKEALKYKK